MKTDYDVIIVGAGPAGASCAKHLVDNGIKTLVIDKEKLPRDKSCSGIIFNDTIKFLVNKYGNIPQNILCDNKYKMFRFSFDGIKYNKFPLRKNLNIKRKDFDFYLINESKSDVKDKTCYLGHSKLNNTINVKIKYLNKISVIKCNYLIGADGSYSTVRKKIENSFNKYNYAIGLQRIIKANNKIDNDIFFHLFNKNYSDFFSWFGVKDDYFKYGTSFYYKNIKNDHILKLESYLKNKFDLEKIKIIKDEKIIINLNNNYLFGDSDNIFLTGEAASLTGAFGEGIHYALLSGKLLAESINNSKHKDIFKIYLKKIKKVLKIINFSNNFLNFNKKLHKFGVT